MSARVNLLPPEVEERNVARRRTVAMGIAGLVLVGVLVAAYLFQLGRVGDTEDRLEAQQQRVDQLNSELTQLAEFQELERRSDIAEDLLEAALGDEVTMAGLMQDLAAVFPSDTELRDLIVTLSEAPTPELGATRVPIGRMILNGASVNDHAPGLERLMLELSKVAAFSNVYFTGSTQIQDTSAVEFNVEVDLGPELRTNRYTDGLPEELR